MEQMKKKLAEYMKEHLPDYLPQTEKYRIRIEEILKENDVKRTAVIVSEKGEMEHVSACLFLESFLEEYEYPVYRDLEQIAGDRETCQKICREMASVYEANRMTRSDFDFVKASQIHSFPYVKPALRAGICDPDRNREMLKTLVSDRIGDFAQYYYLADFLLKDTMLKVTNRMLEGWKVSKEELREATMENMKQEMRLVPMEEFMEGACTKDELEKNRERGMYVLTNQKGCYGAGMILHPDIQKLVSDKMEGDYYVLPSSLHEVLIVSDNPETDLDDLTAEVKMANERVGEEDLLSYHVQHYSASAQTLENACQYQKKVKADPQKYGKEQEKTAKQRTGMVRG